MPAITIATTTPLDKAFRYFWMKSVRGFSPSQHCARCLIGSYVKQVGLDAVPHAPLTIPGVAGDVFYLCGVAKPYKWANNFHLALRVAEGCEATEPLYCGGTVIASGFERIPFDARVATERFPDLGAAYLTCRNFQFGAQLFTPTEAHP